MKLTLLASALALSIFSLSPASAAPAASGLQLGAQPSVIQAQFYQPQQRAAPRRAGPPRHAAPRRGPPPRYVPGRRYDSPPRGYRRYDRRPGDWNRRGCIMVGPVWFCP